jgi:hypothetical protein
VVGQCIVGGGVKMHKKPIEVFFSYSHQDEKLRDELAKHLSILERQGIISSWHDRQIPAGIEWAGEIDEHLNTARIILLLISSDFLASNYCYSIEMERAIKRHETGEAQVIPVILRPVDWQGAPFEKLQALPKNARPVTSWTNQDEAFADVTRGIRKAVDGFGPLSNDISIQDKLKKLWERMLVAKSVYEFKRIRYELQEILHEYPNNPRALELLGDIDRLISQFELREAARSIEEHGDMKNYIIDELKTKLGYLLEFGSRVSPTTTNLRLFIKAHEEFSVLATFASEQQKSLKSVRAVSDDLSADLIRIAELAESIANQSHIIAATISSGGNPATQINQIKQNLPTLKNMLTKFVSSIR